MRTQSKIYRGYELSAVRNAKVWDVRVWPLDFQLPSPNPSEEVISHRDVEIAFARASRQVDSIVGAKTFSRHVVSNPKPGAAKPSGLPR